MRTRWVGERSATDVRRVGRRVRELRGRGSRCELAREVALELDGERAHVFRRIEAPPEAYPIGERQPGAREKRAALAQQARIPLDNHGLHRRGATAGKRAPPPGETPTRATDQQPHPQT